MRNVCNTVQDVADVAASQMQRLQQHGGYTPLGVTLMLQTVQGLRALTMQALKLLQRAADVAAPLILNSLWCSVALQRRMQMRLFARKPQGVGLKGSVENLVRAEAGALALVHVSIGQEDFLRHCIDALPRPAGRRDTRKQTLVRALRRLQERGELPFGVEGDRFVFD